MKKILPILIALLMVVSIPTALGDVGCDCCEDGYDQSCDEYDCPPYDEEDSITVDTTVTIANALGGGTGTTGETTGWNAPIIKAKWEVTDSSNQNDDDMICYNTQVAPNVGGKKIIHYYAAILEQSAAIHSVYAYVFHPDCTYKYKVPMTVMEETAGQSVWNLVTANNPTVVEYAEGYDEAEVGTEVIEYLNCKIYHGTAEIDYCQPGGCYKVGVRAFDGLTWSAPLWNTFWYIPTAAIALDFCTVDYGNAVTVCKNTWTEGNKVWDDGIYTIRNYGNVPVDLRVLQDDMMFSTDSTGAWNVEYDARLGAEGTTYLYDPFCEYGEWPSGSSQDATYFGTLPLCTEEKIDFSIHVKEAMPGATYDGHMTIFAVMNGDQPWTTPEYNCITGEDLKQTPPPGILYPPCCTV